LISQSRGLGDVYKRQTCQRFDLTVPLLSVVGVFTL
jgi:hypothetical protein